MTIEEQMVLLMDLKVHLKDKSVKKKNIKIFIQKLYKDFGHNLLL